MRPLKPDITTHTRIEPDGLWTIVSVRGEESDGLLGLSFYAKPEMPGMTEVMSGRPARVDARPDDTRCTGTGLEAAGCSFGCHPS